MRKNCLLLTILIQLIPMTGMTTLRTLDGEVKIDSGAIKYRIHGDDEKLPLLNAVHDILQGEEVKKLLGYFDYIPKSPIHFFLDSKSRVANGYAMAFPHNFISLFDFPPLDRGQLSSSPQWMKILVLHELTHIIHIDHTEGFIDTLRSLFGSIVKPQMVVPRWVTEGIAVWAETEFTSGGRNRSIQLEYQVFLKLLDSENENGSCHNIGCLDNPGEYPGGSSPYWFGGQFIGYLENQKPGSVKCIVDTNARKIPFFLADVFTECFEKSADELFLEFRAHYLKKFSSNKKITNELLSQQELKNISSYSGMAIKNNHLYYISYKDEEQYIQKKNLENNEVETFELHERIDHLKLDSKKEIILKSYTGLDERGKRKLLTLKDNKFETSEFESAYKFSKMEVDYKDFKWTFKNNEKEMSFNPGEWVYEAYELGDRTYFKYSSLTSNKSVLSFVDQSLRAQSVFNLGINESHIIGSCGDFLVVWQELKNNHRVFLYDGGSKISGQYFKNVVQVAPGDEKFAVFTDKKQSVFSCNSFWKNGEKKTVKTSKLNLKKQFHSEIAVNDSRFYPGGRDLLPQYWYFFYSRSGNLDYSLIRTGISDPKGDHNLSLGANYYFENSEWAPQVTYIYSPKYFFIGATYYEYYSQNSLDTDIDQDKFAGVLLGHQYIGEWFALLGQFDFYDAEEDDIFGKRDSDLYSFSHIFQYVKKRKYAFLNHFVHKSRLTYNRLKDPQESFKSLRTSAGVGFNLTRDLKLSFEGGYTRLFKDNFRDGVAYGGGTASSLLDNDFSYNNFHGIPYSDIYGNIIYNYGFELYYAARRPYSQKGFFPLQTKTWGPVIGSDYIRSDFMIIDDTIVRDSYAHSIWGGIRSSVRAFYFADINIDLGYAHVQGANLDQGQLLLDISGEF